MRELRLTGMMIRMTKDEPRFIASACPWCRFLGQSVVVEKFDLYWCEGTDEPRARYGDGDWDYVKGLPSVGSNLVLTEAFLRGAAEGLVPDGICKAYLDKIHRYEIAGVVD